jgi:hypothetical protein
LRGAGRRIEGGPQTTSSSRVFGLNFAQHRTDGLVVRPSRVSARSHPGARFFHRPKDELLSGYCGRPHFRTLHRHRLGHRRDRRPLTDEGSILLSSRAAVNSPVADNALPAGLRSCRFASAAYAPPRMARFSERVSPPPCSAATPPRDGRTNGISEDKSDNEPDCEDDCRINCSHSRKSLPVLCMKGFLPCVTAPTNVPPAVLGSS